MLEDILESLDLKIVGITIIMWAITVFVIWKGIVVGDFFTIKLKISMTVLMLPMCYIVIAWQISKS